MAHHYVGEPTNFVARHFYLEFDLVVQLDVPANDSTSNTSGCCGGIDDDGRRPIADVNSVYEAILRHNAARAKHGLLQLLEQRGVPVLDSERLVGPGHQAYLSKKCAAYPVAAACLEDGEPIPDRFWQLQPAPATELCPAPLTRPVPDADGKFDPAAIHYPYAGKVLRSPIIKTSTLPLETETAFLREMETGGQPPAWVDRTTNREGAVCTWGEVQYVMHILKQWSNASPLHEFHVVNPPPEEMDNGTNTGLRILVKTRNYNSESAMPLLQMKKTVALLWYLETNFHHLCHPRQRLNRVQSFDFPSWSQKAPLCGKLWQHSVAAIAGGTQAKQVEGHLLQGLLQYIPRNMVYDMAEYKKLSHVFMAKTQGELCLKLQMADTLPGPDVGDTVVPSIGWPFVGTYRLIGYDRRHRPVPCPVLAIGGFQTTPFDAKYYRMAAQLVDCCTLLSVLSPREFQNFILRIQDTTLPETGNLLATIGVDAAAWGDIIETYPNIQRVMELDEIDVPYDNDELS